VSGHSAQRNCEKPAPWIREDLTAMMHMAAAAGEANHHRRDHVTAVSRVVVSQRCTQFRFSASLQNLKVAINNSCPTL